MTALTPELQQKFEDYNQDQFNIAFTEACECGELDIVKYLSTSSKLKQYINFTLNTNRGFRRACEQGHVAIVEYLLTSQALKEYAEIHAQHIEDFQSLYGDSPAGYIDNGVYITPPELNPPNDIDDGFQLACKNGHLDLVKYLLTSPDLKKHADVHADHDYGFRSACQNGHLDVVKYLLTSPDLKEHADIHACGDLGFLRACQEKHLDVIAYLLSFNDKQCIDFQNADYGLDWAIKNQFDDVIIAMMNNLKNNHFIGYVDCLRKIEKYNNEIYERAKNIQMDDLHINSSQERVLYL